MREEPATTTDALRDLSESVRRGSRLIAGSLIVSALIIAATLSPDRSLREGVLAVLIVCGIGLLLLLGLRKEIHRGVHRRRKLRQDEARKAALSGRSVPFSPERES
jgi:hypothetical protein